jgi:hypothetical protein
MGKHVFPFKLNSGTSVMSMKSRAIFPIASSRCNTQYLSYIEAGHMRIAKLAYIKRGRKPYLEGLPSSFRESGREDLNLRPPQPHCGALPGCATPRYWNNSSIADNSPHSQGFIASDHSTKYARSCCTSANPC